MSNVLIMQDLLQICLGHFCTNWRQKHSDHVNFHLNLNFHKDVTDHNHPTLTKLQPKPLNQKLEPPHDP
jgi:hypothetical protein